ncbi:type-2 ice-structuring protein-like [Boleophthalmus pectinirostris]|uniref:type-2 ice-structuring protein-like n=1 Tax=Boleophthalmus pectinirostris TaxID=150288 RepID=UPI0024309CF2|nr:type-2 ice-structuring protein-like [Boleophthalmus pectinirostris]XP_055014892.1 type-2 ice-structuring protein-like [Boleophthalmus pectinirostris]
MKLLVVLLFVGAVMAQRREGTATPMSVNDNHQEEGGPGTWEPFNGRWFTFVTAQMPWSMAQMSCMTLGGSLATIHSPQEDKFVSYLAQGTRAWIGFSDAQNEGHWLWINSEPDTYTGWCPGQPDNWHGEHCATINLSSDLCWNDENCNNKRPFVCVK